MKLWGEARFKAGLPLLLSQPLKCDNRVYNILNK